MNRNYGTYLYHPKEAPEGRIFYDDEEGMKKLEGKGWVDSPSKFQEEKPKATPSKPSGKSSSKSKSSSKKDEKPAPETEASDGSADKDAGGADEGMTGDESGDDAVELPPKAEMVKALKDAGVDIDGRASDEKIEAAYLELISGEE